MSNDLALVEQSLRPLAPRFADVLPKEIPADRLIRTVVVACENNPYLMQCDRGSLLRSAMTAAVLGLEVDNAIGAAYLVPFRGKVQLIVGYKGFCAIAARSGRTLEGFLVREGDDFTFDEANGIVSHKKALGGEKQRKVLGAYAVSRGNGLPTMVRVMSLDEILAVRDRSAGYKAAPDRSPWTTDFDPMARKCPVRMLAKDIPNISLQAAVALDTHHDLGHETYIRQDSAVIVDGEVVPDTKPNTGPEGLTRKPDKDAVLKKLQLAASHGMASLKADWGKLTKPEQDVIDADTFNNLKAEARQADAS